MSHEPFLFFILRLFYIIVLVDSLRDNDKTRQRYSIENLPLGSIAAYPLVPDYSEYYYYPSIRHKMAEAMSVNNCSMSGN